MTSFPTSIWTPTRTGAASACARSSRASSSRELEDDFHHFVVTLLHDGEHVLVVRELVAPLAVGDVPRRGRAPPQADGHAARPPIHRGRRCGPTRSRTARTSSTPRATRSRTPRAGRDAARLRHRDPAPRPREAATPTCACGSTAGSRSPGRSTGPASSTLRLRSTRRRGAAASCGGPTRRFPPTTPNARSRSGERATSGWDGAWTSTEYRSPINSRDDGGRSATRCSPES